jgi:hypothetical protein
MALEFTTGKKRREPIPFTLDGHDFVFNPPKLAGAVLDALDDDEGAGALLDWFAQGLDEETEKFITARLRDEQDDLDVEDLGNVIKALMEKVVGRPIKSRPGLRRPR